MENKPRTKPKPAFYSRLDPDLLAQLRVIAENEHRSLAGQIEQMIFEGIQRREQELTDRMPPPA